MSHKENSTKPAMLRRVVMMAISTVVFLLPATGCVSHTTIREIPADRWVATVKKGQLFEVPSDGFFVPKAQFNEMMDAYMRESFR